MDDFDFSGLSELTHTPEYLKAKFNFYLRLLEIDIDRLADRMRNLGDYRSRPTIIKSLQRMASGETKTTGEMLVLLRLLGREFQLKKVAPELEWTQFQDGTWSAKTDDFAISLHPQTRGRWHVNLTHLVTAYSPPWPAWQNSLEAAKRKGIECLCEARLHLKDWEFEEALHKQMRQVRLLPASQAMAPQTSHSPLT